MMWRSVGQCTFVVKGHFRAQQAVASPFVQTLTQTFMEACVCCFLSYNSDFVFLVILKYVNLELLDINNYLFFIVWQKLNRIERGNLRIPKEEM